MEFYHNYYTDRDKIPELTYKEFLEIRNDCFSSLCCDFWNNSFTTKHRLQKLAMFIDRYAIEILKNNDKST